MPRKTWIKEIVAVGLVFSTCLLVWSLPVPILQQYAHEIISGYMRVFELAVLFLFGQRLAEKTMEKVLEERERRVG